MMLYLKYILYVFFLLSEISDGLHHRTLLIYGIVNEYIFLKTHSVHELPGEQWRERWASSYINTFIYNCRKLKVYGWKILKMQCVWLLIIDTDLWHLVVKGKYTWLYWNNSFSGLLWLKRKLSSDSQQFYQYQQSEQPSVT